LTARSIIALDDSDILAFASEGSGGNVNLNTRAFFGQNYRPAPRGTDPTTLDGNDRVDINASGTLSSGIITRPDTSFIQNSLNQLPNNQIDTNKLLAQTCLIRQDQPECTFYITGTGGIPNRPNDPALSDYPTNTLQPTTQTAQRPWKLGDPIIEPQGFYKLADGRFVMSRECSQ
jgi:large exoprotein involved in heme utilization and adhesion